MPSTYAAFSALTKAMRFTIIASLTLTTVGFLGV